MLPQSRGGTINLWSCFTQTYKQVTGKNRPSNDRGGRRGHSPTGKRDKSFENFTILPPWNPEQSHY